MILQAKLIISFWFHLLPSDDVLGFADEIVVARLVDNVNNLSYFFFLLGEDVLGALLLLLQAVDLFAALLLPESHFLLDHVVLDLQLLVFRFEVPDLVLQPILLLHQLLILLGHLIYVGFMSHRLQLPLPHHLQPAPLLLRGHVHKIQLQKRTLEGALPDGSRNRMRGIHRKISEINGNLSALLLESPFHQIDFESEGRVIGSDEELRAMLKYELAVGEWLFLAVANSLGPLADVDVEFNCLFDTDVDFLNLEQNPQHINMNKSSRILPAFALETHLSHFTAQKPQQINLFGQLVLIFGIENSRNILYLFAEEKSLFLKELLHEVAHFLKPINHTFTILDSSVKLLLHIPFQFLLLSPVIFPIYLFLPFPSNFLLPPD